MATDYDDELTRNKPTYFSPKNFQIQTFMSLIVQLAYLIKLLWIYNSRVLIFIYIFKTICNFLQSSRIFWKRYDRILHDSLWIHSIQNI